MKRCKGIFKYKGTNLGGVHSSQWQPEYPNLPVQIPCPWLGWPHQLPHRQPSSRMTPRCAVRAPTESSVSSRFSLQHLRSEQSTLYTWRGSNEMWKNGCTCFLPAAIVEILGWETKETPAGNIVSLKRFKTVLLIPALLQDTCWDLPKAQLHESGGW